MDRPKIVCLCGSTRFEEEYRRLNLEFTLKDYIVLSVGCMSHSQAELAKLITPEIKERLDRLHLHKIQLADEVFIINKDGYIGESTRREIQYAGILGKEITYLEPPKTT